MEKTVEEEKLKAQKNKKIWSIVLIIAGILLIVWTAIMIIQNPTKTERTVLNAVIGAVQDTKNPSETQLIKCGKITEAKTYEGKEFRYCVVEMKLKDDDGQTKTDYYCLTVGGSGKNKIYSKNDISALKSPEKDKIEFKIDSSEDVSIKRINSTLNRYWDFQGIK